MMNRTTLFHGSLINTPLLLLPMISSALLDGSHIFVSCAHLPLLSTSLVLFAMLTIVDIVVAQVNRPEAYRHP